MTDTNSEFDADKALAELAEGTPYQGGRRLTFNNRCTAFCALQRGIKMSVIQKGFDLSSGGASHLRNCLKTGRYPEVIEEWNRLGESGFNRKYYTDDIHTRLMRIKYLELNKVDVNPRGPSLRADKYAFKTFGAFPLADLWWRIDWTNAESTTYRHEWDDGHITWEIEKSVSRRWGLNGAGWRFHDCDRGGVINWEEKNPYSGTESIDRSAEPRPFHTSRHAYEGVQKMLGLRK